MAREAGGGTQGQGLGKLQLKSSQGVCSELVLMENNFLQKDAPWVDPDCAEITSGVGSQRMGD